MTVETLVNDGNAVILPSTDLTADTSSTTTTNGTGKQSTSAVMHRSLHHDPPRVVGSRGNYIDLEDGRRILDATGGAAVSCIGHNDKRIHDAILKQLQVNEYCHSLLYGTPAAEEISRFLVASTGGLLSRVYICSSGSEAMEAALKLTRQYHVENGQPNRTHVIARQQSYHGITLGALGAGGHVARRKLYEPWLMSAAGTASRVSPCYAYRVENHLTEVEYVATLIAELEREFQRVGPDTVAGFVAEPVVGAALGCVIPVKGYFPAVRALCDKYGALLILDEVMCGSGRVGPVPTETFPDPLHAWQDPLIGVTPDIMTMGKGLGGGYMPVAAMLASPKVMDVLAAGSGAFSHGQTYQEHPVACATALAVQRVVSEERLVANVHAMGKLFGKLLREQVGSHPAVGDVRGMGLFWGIEFVADKTTKAPFPVEKGVAAGIQQLAWQAPFNISLYPGNGSVDGVHGDHVLLAPAYNVTEEDIRSIVDTTAAAVQRYFELHPELNAK